MSWTGKCVGTVSKISLNKNNVDKDRRPPTVDRVSIFSVDTKFTK